MNGHAGAGGRFASLRLVSALRHPNYRTYWFGFLVSIIGVQVQTVAQGYLIYEKTGSALNLGIVSGSQAVAMIVFSLLGGVIADRVERRRLLVLMQAGGFACSLTLASLVMLDRIEVWQVAAIAFTFGCFQAFDQPTRSALLPQLIDRSDLMNAVALTSVVWQASAIVGPSIAGIVIAFAGLAACFYLAAAGFLTFAVALLAIKVRQIDATELKRSRAGSIIQDLKAGLGYIRGNSLFTALIGMAFFNATFGLSFLVLLPVFAKEELAIGPQGLGALYSAMGIGSLVGTLIVASLGDYPRKGLLIIGGACLFGSLLILFSISTWIVASIALLMAIGVVRSLYMTSSMTLLQLRLEDRYRGRVTAVYGLQWGLMPLGGLWAGVVADLWGAPAAVAFGGIAVILCSALVAVRQPEFRRPLEPAPA
jgi:MFS family permease